MKHLLALQETAWLVFLLEKAMNLLTPSDKPTLHLVLPIREAMMTILNSEPCTSFTHPEAKAIIKAIKYELESGLLAVKENDIHHKRCMVATSLYPYASHITSPEQLEKYIATAKEFDIAFQLLISTMLFVQRMERRGWISLILITSCLYFTTNLVCHYGILVKEERIDKPSSGSSQTLVNQVRIGRFEEHFSRLLSTIRTICSSQGEYFIH